ncbi:MAG: 30S ribosomal protein S6--L-glutamate ligase [Xanthomonadaceae bacterium]|nr:30S ribosomal protein S6--L-glutamate ligase [Xanthomonadaceae bacterium]
MRIAIMSRSRNIYSTRRLIEAGRARDHEVRVVDTLRCYMNIASHRPTMHHRGEVLEDFDAVIPRIGASITFYGTAVLRQFEMMGTFPLNESVAVTRSRDKLRSLQLLSRRGIGLPVTGFARAAGDSADIRCFVVGDKVVASIKRQAKPGEFRSNLHRGGTASLIKITPEERSTAVRAARIMGLNVCGVDLLRSNHGPLVMEVNSSPGLEGIETATGKDVAGMIIAFMEKSAKRDKTRTRGTG